MVLWGALDIGQVASQENRSLDSVGEVFIVETLACVVQVTKKITVAQLD